jgi:hypothetical protein
MSRTTGKPRETPMANMFQIGRHVLQVFGEGRRWVVAVDGVLLRGWHASTSDAWSAGVAEVDRLQRSAPPEVPAVPEAATGTLG